MAAEPSGGMPAAGVPVRLRRRQPVPAWPHDLLDVDALISSGWRPQPFRQFVLKVHGRCNLVCDYCYVYQSPDQSWRRRPPSMSDATVVAAAERIGEHAAAHGMAEVAAVLHGGEPLLAGPDSIAYIAKALRSRLPTGTRLELSVQTNGTLLDDAFLAVLDEHDIRVGVSLDGPQDAHDRRRHRGGGDGSHDAAVRGLALLRSGRYRHLYAGILAVIDPWSDPVATYDHLLTHEPPTLDFLLPHANWSRPPDRGGGGSAAPYGDWLVEVFDRWYAAHGSPTTVRLFEEIIRMSLGRPSRIESVGLSPACVIVVETDGTVEHVDALKSAYAGATRTGLDVQHDPFDAALTDPQVVARQIGLAGLAPTCRACGIRAVCGGGYYPHRYHPSTGFLNRSVYCDDLARLITHVHARVDRELARWRAARASSPPA